MAWLTDIVAALPAGVVWLSLFMVAGAVGLVRSRLHPSTFALIAWPGTVAHELAHALVGFLLGAKPRTFSFAPTKLANGTWELGSVGFMGIRWWNAPWTAMAPMLLAPLSFWLVYAWVYPSWMQDGVLVGMAKLYLCSVLLQSSWPSATDFKIAAPGIGVLILAAAALY